MRGIQFSRIKILGPFWALPSATTNIVFQFTLLFFFSNQPRLILLSSTRISIFKILRKIMKDGLISMKLRTGIERNGSGPRVWRRGWGGEVGESEERLGRRGWGGEVGEERLGRRGWGGEVGEERLGRRGWGERGWGGEVGEERLGRRGWGGEVGRRGWGGEVGEERLGRRGWEERLGRCDNQAKV